MDGLGVASSLVGKTHDGGFETALVTRRLVHIALLVVRGDRAPPRADRDEAAVTAAPPCSQCVEPGGGLRLQRVLGGVDMAHRFTWLGGKPWARVQRSVSPHRVRVLRVDFAGPHVDAVERRKSTFLRFFPKERHLLVEEMAGVTGRAAATSRTGGRHAGTAERLSTGVNRGERNEPSDCWGRRRCRDDRLERHLDKRVGEVLLLQEIE